MPGANSQFNASKPAWLPNALLTRVPYLVVLMTLGIQFWGMARWYYFMEDKRHTQACYLLTTFFALTDTMIFLGLFRTKNADPGYLIPDDEPKQGAQLKNKVGQDEAMDVKKDESNGPKQEEQVLTACRKCSYERQHYKISHCSRCDRCVNYMDHHCTFTDNCIGKDNLRHFFHFTGWAVFSMAVGYTAALVQVYTQNVEKGYGAQSISHALSQSPQAVVFRLICTLGYSDAWFDMATVDGTFFIVLQGLITTAAWPCLCTLMNLLQGSSEVLKLKRRRTGQQFDQKPMSLKEARDFIFGKDATVFQILFTSLY